MIEFHSIEQLTQHLESGKSLDDAVIQSIDVTGVAKSIMAASVSNTVFLGCPMPAEVLANVVERGANIFPAIKGLPFNPYAPALYSADTLFDKYDAGNPCSYCHTTDAKVYQYWLDTGGPIPSTIFNALARRLHDHAMTDAVEDFLTANSNGGKIVGIMGGHSLERSERSFLAVAKISRDLTRKGYLLVSGGGPGAMEATHVGAWFVDRSDSELESAIQELAQAPSYKGKQWLSAAFRVRAKYPPKSGDSHVSLGIPTWLYGHEPPTPFATHIAKYFANSVREEGLVTIATAGLVFAPGNAGTIQEAFQDATQNHYVTTGVSSPMVFLNEDYWTNEKPIYPVLKKLAEGEPYHDLVAIFDDADFIVDFIEQHPPVASDVPKWSFCEAHCNCASA